VRLSQGIARQERDDGERAPLPWGGQYLTEIFLQKQKNIL